MRHEILAPESMLPKRDPNAEFVCECMFRPVKLKRRECKVLVWLKQAGEAVKSGEAICDADVEKKTVEFVAPCDGVLVEQCIPEGGIFTTGAVLGVIEEQV